MGTIAVLMAGQGAQRPGMGEDFARDFEVSREIFALADRVLGISLSSLCFQGTAEDLAATDVCQPAILTTGLAIAAAVEERCPALKSLVGATLGLSLGEYTALVFGGALTTADGMRLVRKRGELMQEASRRIPSGMASILGLDLAKVEECCRAASATGIVSIANRNAPGQIVISGSLEALAAAEERCRNAGARRVIRLKVAGAFHSEVMRPAEDGLRAELDGIEILPPRFPIVANVSAEATTDPGALRRGLGEQLCRPVRWSESLETCFRRGIRTFLEFGPGRVGTGLVKKTLRNVTLLSVETVEDLPNVLEALEALAAARGDPPPESAGGEGGERE